MTGPDLPGCKVTSSQFIFYEKISYIALDYSQKGISKPQKDVPNNIYLADNIVSDFS